MLSGIRFRSFGNCWSAPVGSDYEIIVVPFIVGERTIWQASVAHAATGEVLNSCGNEFVALASTKAAAVRFLIEMEYRSKSGERVSLSGRYSFRLRFGKEGSGIPRDAVRSEDIPFYPAVKGCGAAEHLRRALDAARRAHESHLDTDVHLKSRVV